MGHSRVRIKVRRRKVAALAAYSRKFTVKNNTIPKSDKEFFMIPFSSKNVDTTGKYWFVPGVPGTMFIKHEKPDPETGNRYVMVDYSWEHKKYPQPKSYWKETVDEMPTMIKSTSLYKDPVKMNRVQYMEKLVEHKLAKWERKNVCPEAMFTEDVAKWKQERETMKERFRDFVVSIYDKLHLTGRFVVAENSYTEEKVAEIKDIDGEGHHINDLPKTSKLIKKAQKITNEVKSKRQNLVATNLKDHKKQKGRIILPQAA